MDDSQPSATNSQPLGTTEPQQRPVDNSNNDVAVEESVLSIALAAAAMEEGDNDGDDDEGSALIAEAQRLMDKITASPNNPNPTVLHALSCIVETQESRYMEESGYISSNSSRTSHNIGRLGSLLRDNDEFFDLISEKFLSETRYPISVQAAALRLFLSTSPTWTYPHDFVENVLEKIKGWVMDENVRISTEEENGKHDNGDKTSSDFEMLRTYSTGLLAVALTGGGPVVEDVLSSGLSSKLMRYLRTRVLGDTITGQKDVAHQADKNVNTMGTKGSKENRGRFRHPTEATHLADSRFIVDRALGDNDRSIKRESRGETSLIDDGGPPKCLPQGEGVDKDDIDVDDQDRWYGQDICDVTEKYGGLDDDKDGASRRKVYREWARTRGNERVSEDAVASEIVTASPGSGIQLVQGRSNKDKSLLISSDVKKVPGTKMSLSKINADVSIVEREDNDECFQECIIGTKDISDLVKKAVRAAEDEARAAFGPAEAIRAAGDAAAEVVKSAALEEFKNTGNDEAAVLAASRAASTVIDAANATDVSRIPRDVNADSVNGNPTEPDIKEEIEEFFVRDKDTLAKLREKYSIQCLETLGEYVEVLGPVLHEKGVDVCLALLHRSSKDKEPSKVAVLLPDVLKLISALSAHRKFSALFVDRGGMQKLLSVPRINQTFFGLSSCLFTIGSLQGIMERVCTLPSDVVHHVVELALRLLECSQEQARKNAALFFNAAFVFRAVLDCFDAQDGLQKLLSLLNDTATVRSGVNSRALAIPNSGSFRNDRSPADVLTSSEKQIAFHTCVALRQYFRAHLLLLVDSIRPNKNNRSAVRNLPSLRAPYKPLDISNEAMDAVFLQLQRDRKLGPAFVRARWPEVDQFLSSNGHIIMLELCQAPRDERYLHDLLQYALGVLHIVSLVPYSRKLVVNATLSNDRVGIAVILDAAHSTSHVEVEPEVIQPALNVLVNLVCPPPSISNKPSHLTQGQQSVPSQATNFPATETRERNTEKSAPENAVLMTSQSELRERNVEPSVMGRSGLGTSSISGTSQTPVPTVGSGLVGDRRIVLGAGAGSAGLAAQLEQGYSQAREAVRSNNGIKVLLQLLQPRVGISPAALDCLRALACRVLLGLARDDTIAHILTKLQVGKKLSELIRDPSSQAHGTEQGRWQAELAQAAIELIAIVTNCGRASTLAATDAAVPTLRRIERAAIAAATPITYHSRELLLLVHEHLQASGLATTAAALLEEAQLTPLPSLAGPSTLFHQVPEEGPPLQIQWPSGRAPCGFLNDMAKCITGDEESRLECDSAVSSSKKKPLVFSPTLSFRSRKGQQSHDSNQPSNEKGFNSLKKTSTLSNILESPTASSEKPSIETESLKTPLILPLKRKLTDLKDGGFISSAKRLQVGEHAVRSPIFPTPNLVEKSGLVSDSIGFSTPTPNLRDQYRRSTPSSVLPEMDNNQITPSTFQPAVSNDPLPVSTERLTLDSVVVQYLKHQHRQCPAPITTLPPLSLFHPHVCPEPKRNLDAPSNVTARLGTREFRSMYSGIRGSCRDRQFVYSRFRPWRTCRDDGALLTCITFLQKSSQIAVGSHSGELKTFDSDSNILLESCTSHQSHVTLVQSYLSEERQLLLSSSYNDVRLWDANSITGGPTHVFEGCKAARFSNYGTVFAALSSEPSQREILLYDTNTCNLDLKLSDTSTSSSGRGHGYSIIHFSPSDTMLLWNGVLWDRRSSGPIHRFDQFTDYGGGGFHPAGNEVIINSEVWDLRKFKLLRSVPSLDQTTITFNGQGDVIYANLRRNLDDITSAVNNRRAKHPLFSAFRTVDAINYSDIATIPLDRRCVLDFTKEPTDSFLGLVLMDDQEDMFASARIYEIGRRRPMDDDSDPDDAESEEDEDDDDEDGDDDPIHGTDLFGDNDSEDDDLSIDDDESIGGDDDDDDDDADVNLIMNEGDFDFGGFDMMSDGDEDDDDSQIIESYSSDDEED